MNFVLKVWNRKREPCLQNKVSGCDNFLLLFFQGKVLPIFIILEPRCRSSTKVIYPKYSKHWTVAHTIDCVCSKMFNHGLNHRLFLSLFKLIPCPKHWKVHVLAYLSFIFEWKVGQELSLFGKPQWYSTPQKLTFGLLSYWNLEKN